MLNIGGKIKKINLRYSLFKFQSLGTFVDIRNFFENIIIGIFIGEYFIRGSLLQFLIGQVIFHDINNSCNN